MSETWCLKSQGPDTVPGWWRKTRGVGVDLELETRWTNSSGGWHPASPTDYVWYEGVGDLHEVCQRPEAVKIQRDAALRFLCEKEPSGDNGWLTVEGELLPCRFENHSWFCDLYFVQDEREVELRNVKLSNGFAYIPRNERLTSHQRRWLDAHGYDSTVFLDRGVTNVKRKESDE